MRGSLRTGNAAARGPRGGRPAIAARSQDGSGDSDGDGDRSEHGARPRFRPCSGRSWGKAGLIPAGGLFQQGPAPLPLLPARWRSPSRRGAGVGASGEALKPGRRPRPRPLPPTPPPVLNVPSASRAEITQTVGYLQTVTCTGRKHLAPGALSVVCTRGIIPPDGTRDASASSRRPAPRALGLVRSISRG